MTYEFQIKWYGAFPLDMLRYDRCWPVDQKSVEEISFACSGEYDLVYTEHTATLASLQRPTVGRWKSFGVEVRQL